MEQGELHHNHLQDWKTKYRKHFNRKGRHRSAWDLGHSTIFCNSFEVWNWDVCMNTTNYSLFSHLRWQFSTIQYEVLLFSIVTAGSYSYSISTCGLVLFRCVIGFRSFDFCLVMSLDEVPGFIFADVTSWNSHSCIMTVTHHIPQASLYQDL